MDGVADLDRHLARMKASADALDFRFDRHEARNELQAATFRAGPSRLRLLLSRAAARWRSSCGRCRPRREEPVEVALAPLPVAPRRFPPAPQDQRPRLLRRGAARRGRVRDRLRRRRGLPHRGQLHQPVRRARRHAADAAARARPAARRAARRGCSTRGGPKEADLQRGRSRRRLPDRQCGARPRSRAVKVAGRMSRGHEDRPTRLSRLSAARRWSSASP